MPSKDGWKELLTWDCPPAPEVSVRLGDAMLSFETDHVNEQMFTYSINARSVSWAKLHYTDSITKATYTQDLPKDNLVGMVYIPANRPWCNVYIDAHVYDGEGKEDGFLWNRHDAEHSLGTRRGYPVTKTDFYKMGTREQAATMLMRYAAFKGYDVSARDNLAAFSDASSVSIWA